MFYINDNDGLLISYSQLFEDIKNLPYIYTCKRFEHTYDFYVNLLSAIINQIDLIIVDNNISDKEYELLMKSNDLDNKVYKNNQNKIDFNNLYKEFLKYSNVNLTLFTSGTTGIPKKVTHKLASLNQSVKVSDYYNNDIWGLAYNPTHIAGLQVFFQALLNKNLIIDIYNTSRSFVLNSFNKYKITNLSATPTFYRLLLPIPDEHSFLKQITVGGEKSDKNLIIKLKESFKNARITNIYASTEAGQILKSKGDFFKIENEKVKIENNEILIHKNLLGDNDFSKGEWYHTGDLIEYIDSNKEYFKIVSRKNDVINSGGYMVNLTEIEELIIEIDGISDARVYSKSNAVVGNLILCEIQLIEGVVLLEKDIKSKLAKRLQPHKIPRIINIVDFIQKTKTGKKIR